MANPGRKSNANYPVEENPEIYETFSSFLYTEKIDEVLKNYGNDERNRIPFFLYLAHQLPHSPFEVPKVYEDMYSDLHVPRNKKIESFII